MEYVIDFVNHTGEKFTAWHNGNFKLNLTQDSQKKLEEVYQKEVQDIKFHLGNNDWLLVKFTGETLANVMYVVN